MPDRTPLRLVLDELGNPTGLAEFREGDTLPIGFVSGLGVELATIDALLQALVETVGENTPPTGVEGQRFIVGTAPTGAWAGQANKLARFLDGTWQFFDARYVLNAADGLWYVRSASSWAVLAGGGGFENPMTTLGDLIVGGAAGAPTRLGLGGALQVLRVNGSGTGVEWAAPSGGGGAQFSPVVVQSTTSRVSLLTDAGATIVSNNVAASTFTLEPQSSVAWAADTEIYIYRDASAASLTLVAGGGVTLKAPVGGSLVLTNTMSVTLKRVSTDRWLVIGQVVPV